jgi:primosomal protein N' (replication factor Y) (superfamily II helicase)
MPPPVTPSSAQDFLDLPGMAAAQPAPRGGQAAAGQDLAGSSGQEPPAAVVRVQLEDSAVMELDYAVPAGLLQQVRVGSRVIVPLQRREVQAVVLHLLDPQAAPQRFKLKAVLRVVGSRPMFSQVMLNLANWISEYYVTPVRQVLRTMLPEPVRNRPETFVTDSQIELAKEWEVEAVEKLGKKAPMQARLLELVRERGGSAALSDLRRELPRATALLKPLLASGWLRRSEVRVERDPFQQDEDFMPSSALTLTAEQAAALEVVQAALKQPAEARPLLLHGVTGSGKTEVFLQAIAQVVAAGQTALVLVPEISLTPQTIERFKARFSEQKDRIAVLHSHLSDGERHDEWFKIHEDRADIVIGARSAIFAPLERLGIIIVDEEHEPSYKQEETPRYQARDVAVVRAKLEGCVVLLASATPSLESYENACRGKYELLRMNHRTDGKKMPLVRVVDMRLARRKGTGMKVQDAGCLSEKLKLAIEDRLEKREQTILFINRRGFHSSLSCTSCGEVVQCQDCSVPMTFHRSDNRLVCHICGARRLPPSKCPACNDPSIKFGGFGTERAESIVREVFPKARIARVDTDTMQRKNQLRDVLREFRSQKLDILIGTQMIAKGLDFPNVTLVGVLNADLALNIPDFRAAERTFQLLVQVAGRAGRGEVLGEVLIQTFTPHSPAIQFSRHSDFDGYAQQELEHRKQFEYPPFSHVLLITSRGKHETQAEFALQTLARRLVDGMPEGVLMGEPCPAPLAKAHGQFRFQLLLRTPRIRALARHVRTVVKSLTLPADVTLVWDVDPMHLG